MTDALGSGLVGFRLATRLARREIFRRPGRTLLVALLIALPVAAMTVATVMVRTDHQTPLQTWQMENGQADAAANYAKPIVARVPGATFVNDLTYVENRLLRTTDSRRSNANIALLDMSNPITRGIVQVLSGRAPTKPGEVFLTRSAAHQLGVKAGDALRLVRPAHLTLRVAGVGELAEMWGGATMIVPPNVPYPWEATQPHLFTNQLIKFNRQLSPAEIARLGKRFDRATNVLTFSPALDAPLFYSNYAAGRADTAKKVRWSWVIGGLVLTVVGIVIAAAFAAGARRQLVTLGQLAGNGAPPNVLRRVLVLQGTLTGLVGTLAGLVLGAAVLVALEPRVDQIFRKDVHPYNVRLLDVVPIIVLGVVTATVAALIPARAAGRIPVLAALGGRRPLGKVPRWIPVTGAFVATGGLALLGLAVLGAGGSNGHETIWILAAMAGGVAVLLGACAIAPAYVSVLEPAAARSRGSWRVATRSLARQRTRTSAVVSAIAATGALVIAASSLVLASSEHNNNRVQPSSVPKDEVQLSGVGRGLGYAPPTADFVAKVDKVLPHSSRFQIQIPYKKNVTFGFTGFKLDHPNDTGYVALISGSEIFNGPPNSNLGLYMPVAIADASLIREYKLSDADQRLLAKEGILALAYARGRANFRAETHVAPHTPKPPNQKLKVTLVDGRKYRIGSLPSVLMTPAVATRLGMDIRPGTVVLHAQHALTTDQRNAILDIATDAQAALPARSESGFNFQYYQPSGAIDPLLLEWLLVAIALVLTLFVVAVNLTLSATETRDERDVLTIVGAAPRTLSSTNGYKAAMLTVMGSVLAIPVGVLPVAVFQAANDHGGPFVFPFAVIALLLLALPLAAGVVTTAASAIALRVRPVRISTMAFD